MVDFVLQSQRSYDGLSFEAGKVVLSDANPVSIISIAPFKGQGLTVDKSLSEILGVGLPKVGWVTGSLSTRCIWAGQGLWFVLGDLPTSKLEEPLRSIAAVTDQSDAWSVFRLTGADVNEVMARLCSLDLNAISVGQTARTEFAHMMLVVTPIEDGFEVMVMRSFAKTAVEHIRGAMTRVAAQRNL